MKKFLLIFVFLLTLCGAYAQTLNQSMYIDFGPTGGTNGAITPSPDVNGHYWNNATSGALNASTSLISGTNAATGYTMLVTDSFVVNTTSNAGTTAPSAATLGDLAIATATEDYFYLETTGTANNTGAFKFTGLNQGKRYKFTLFGSRIAADPRITSFAIAGLSTVTGQITTTNGTSYVSTPLVTDMLQPNASGEISVSVGIVSGGFGYINAVKIEEYNGPLQSVYIDLGPAATTGCTTCATTPSPDSNGRYWNNATSPVVNASTTLVNNSNAATGFSMVVTDNFVVNTATNYGPAAPTAAALGDLAIGTATEDYFYLETGGTANTTGALKFTGLSLSKAYKFTLYGSRVSTDNRVTSYTVTGNATTSGQIVTTNGSAYTGTPAVTGLLQPSASGELSVSFGIVSGSYGYINIIKIEEYNSASLIPVTGITVAGSDITGTGQTQQMTAALSPANATYGNVTWSVSNTLVATISATGLLSPLSGGTVTVTATSVQNPSASGTKVINVAAQTTQLYYSGSTTENGDNPSTALPMKMVTGTNNLSTGIFEIYTSLTSTGTFKFYTQQNATGTIYGAGASAGTIAAAGAAIDPTPTGPVRITVNLTNNTYTILPITWSVVGSSITNDWSGDEPLAYQGNGIWQATVNMNVVASSDPNPRFIFRANQDWSYQMKKLANTNSSLMMESQATAYGDTVGDIDLNYGTYLVTLNLRNYTYSISCTTIDQYKISFMGSSVMNGQGATNLQGYAYMYNGVLAQRATQGSSPFYRSNISINGNNTTNILARWEKDLIGDCGKYVAYGAGLGNEGIHENGQPAYDSYKTNLQLLIQKAIDAGKIPIAENNYTRNDYTATDYEYVKQMNILMAQWNVPTVNLLGAVDNGTGNYVTGYWDDYLHPNNLGHTEMMYAQVPSLFDALEAGKALPTMGTGTMVTPQAGTLGGIAFTPQATIHPFTTSIDVRTYNSGTLIHFTSGAGEGTVSINNAGFLVYTSPAGGTIVGTTAVNDGAWHKVSLTHYYARGITFLYNGATLVGSVNEQLTAATFTVHGANAPTYINYRNWFFWRSGMNALEINAVNSGLMMKSSLELYAPLDGAGIYSSNPYTNRAQSTTTINATGFALCTVTGDQLAYGQDQWKGYLYTGIGDTNELQTAFTAGTYSGYIVQPATFDQNIGAAPIYGDNICGQYADRFSVRYKMQKTYPAGNYYITVGADDAFRLSLDGGVTFIDNLSSWALQAYTQKSAVVYLDGAKSLVLEYYESTGASRVSFDCHPAACPTAPTAIAGGTLTAACAANAVLTATGGTEGDGTTYQWGTGSVVGQNIISGQTGVSITVAATAQTYWVRRGSTLCTPQYTDGVTTQVTVTGMAGDPAVFGDNQWNAYAYSGTSTDFSQNTYAGYYTQTTLGFASQDAWAAGLSPSSAPGWQGCPVAIDNFTFAYKRKGFPCGNYKLSMLNWDDNVSVYVDGTLVWSYNGYSGSTVTPVNLGNFSLTSASQVEIRVIEFGGDANAAIAITPVASAGPVAITPSTLSCSGSTATLTATGAVPGANEVYEWGTGAEGTNSIAGATTASVSLPITFGTTYWVRLKNSVCGATASAAVTYTPAITAPAVYNGSWSSLPNATTAVEVQSNLTLGADFQACSVTVTNGAVLTVNSGVTLTVNGQVNVANGSSLIVNNGGALLQLQDTANTGNITVHKKANTLYRLDYTMWSSPVEGQTLFGFSPQTSTDRFYTYGFNGTNEVFQVVTPTNTVNNANTLNFRPGVGYLIRMPNTDAAAGYTDGTAAIQWEGAFTGVAHNGPLQTALSTMGNHYTAVGNPYPSPINVQQFFAQNSSVLQAGEGMYFWRKKNNANSTSYAVLNTIAYVANDGGANTTNPFDTNNNYGGQQWSSYFNVDNAPSQWVVAPGQGFIIRAANGANTLTFNNTMRRGAQSATPFFRSAVSETQVSRLWFNLGAEGLGFSQTAIAYTADATLGLDYAMDARQFSTGGAHSLYTTVNDDKLAIQARPQFEATDVVPLSYRADAAGSYTIMLFQKDGVFAADQNVYIKDNLLGITHDIKAGAYSFVTEAGTFNTRFEVVYQADGELGTPTTALDGGVIAYAKDGAVTIQAPDMIQKLMIFDITGRLVYNNSDVGIGTFTTGSLAIAQQAIIVKVTLRNGRTYEKKMILD